MFITLSRTLPPCKFYPSPSMHVLSLPPHLPCKSSPSLAFTPLPPCNYVGINLSFSCDYQVEKIDKELFTTLSCSSRGLLPPLAAAVGGFVAQEVLKALTGKFTPLKQWVSNQRTLWGRAMFSTNTMPYNAGTGYTKSG